MEFVILIFLFLFTVTLHEVAHGYVAFLFGDSTAREQGRLTLNPLRHIDFFWTLLLPFILIKMGLPAIGMAKPVPVDFSNLHRPKRDMIWVALAGPVSNILFAWLLALLFILSRQWFLLVAIYFNLGLAVFNLIPIPPLDGARVLTGLLPIRLAREYVKLERFGFLIILALVWLGFAWKVIVPLINLLCALLGVPGIRFE